MEEIFFLPHRADEARKSCQMTITTVLGYGIKFAFSLLQPTWTGCDTLFLVIGGKDCLGGDFELVNCVDFGGFYRCSVIVLNF